MATKTGKPHGFVSIQAVLQDTADSDFTLKRANPFDGLNILINIHLIFLFRNYPSLRGAYHGIRRNFINVYSQ